MAMRVFWKREEAIKVNPEPRKISLGKRLLPKRKTSRLDKKLRRKEMERRRKRAILRRIILKRDNFQCQYCKAKGPKVRLEVDHIRPRSAGGTNELVNLITACHECNKAKWCYRLPYEKEREIRGIAEDKENLRQACMKFAELLFRDEVSR